jgi:hypothetical protein
MWIERGVVSNNDSRFNVANDFHFLATGTFVGGKLWVGINFMA